MKRILERRVVPVVVIDATQEVIPLAETFLRNGLDIMEITFRTPAAEEALRVVAARFPEILLGAGTLLTEDQVERAARAGARFAVAPGLDERVVARAQALGLAMVPGVVTPTEVSRAISLGCRLVKFFPAEAAGGVKMLQALWGPFAHTGVRFIPLGGVNAGNMRNYLDLPAVAAVGGSWMAERKLVAAGDWERIGALVREALALAAAE